MDGPTCAAVITSSVFVGSAIIGGFWKLWVKIGDQNKSIGRLEGKVDGLGTRMHSYEKQLDGFDTRIDRLDKRINGFIDNLPRKEDG